MIRLLIQVREVGDAIAWVKLLGGLGGDRSLLNEMNDRIVINDKAGAYNGCKTAVELAKKMANSRFATSHGNTEES